MKYADISNKQDQVAFIRNKLGSDIAWASKGVIRVFENQPADEQNVNNTIEHNDIGFTDADADILSSFAKQLINGRTMSVKQSAILFKKMPEYAGQLHRMSKEIKEMITEKPQLNYAVLDNDELLGIYDSLRNTMMYYQCAEGNYSQETDARNETSRKAGIVYDELSKRGLV
jgi:hypothetical protein